MSSGAAGSIGHACIGETVQALEAQSDLVTLRTLEVADVFLAAGGWKSDLCLFMKRLLWAFCTGLREKM